METQLPVVRNKLIDKAIFYAVIFIYPLLFASLIRIFYLGWTTLFYFHIAFTISITLLYLFRLKLPVIYKTIIFSLVYYLYSFVGSLYFGLAAGLFFYIFVVIINTVILGFKAGIIALIAAITGLIVAGFLHSSGYITIDVDLNSYSSNFNSWLSYLLAFIFVFVVIIITLGSYNDYFKSNIIALKQKISEKEKIHNELNVANLELEKQYAELHKLNKENLMALEKAEESDRLKTAFLQNISHEVRTPLNAIIGFSGVLKKHDATEENRDKFLSIIINSSNQLLSIINDILTISAIETKQENINIVQVNMNKLIAGLHAIFEIQAKAKNIELRFQHNLPENASIVYSDKTKLIQILTNLLTNALKYTYKGYVEFGYERKSEELEFYVKDTGIGIDPKLHEKVFESFRQGDLSVRKSYGGTGLGLSISKGYVELLGGKIWLRSESDKGSEFFFTIPFKPVDPTVQPE